MSVERVSLRKHKIIHLLKLYSHMLSQQKVLTHITTKIYLQLKKKPINIDSYLPLAFQDATYFIFGTLGGAGMAQW